MPEVDPVTSAVFPERSIFMGHLHHCCGRYRVRFAQPQLPFTRRGMPNKKAAHQAPL
jgi:hypothetical protein